MKETIVGLIFVLAVLFLAFFTIFIKEGKEALNFRETYQVTAYFDNVEGLEIGHKVRVSGLEIGRVQALGLVQQKEFDPNTQQEILRNKIKATLRLNQPISFYEGAKATVKDISALGGKFVEINRGDPEKKEVQGLHSALPGDAVPNVLSTTATVVDENRDDIRRLISGLRKIVEDIQKGEGTLGQLIHSREVYDQIRNTVDNLSKATEKLNSSEGTIGKLLSNAELYDSTLETVNNLNQITGRLMDSKGTIGKLINEPDLHQKLEETLSKLDEALDPVIELVQKINKGEGTLGKLIVDPQMHDELLETVKRARSALTTINDLSQKILKGEGTLGKLVQDDSLYTQLKAALENISAITGKLRQGEGTLGKLLVDDSLYLEAKKVVKNLSDSLEDQREQIPVTTFTTILFNAF